MSVHNEMYLPERKVKGIIEDGAECATLICEGVDGVWRYEVSNGVRV
jgi:hypothetical protein